MSYMATLAQSILIDMFPAAPFKRVFDERYLNYKGQKLFFDFFVPEINVYFEIQGRQHTEFVKHFHGDKSKFLGQKYRDVLKLEYIQLNDLYLVYLNYDETLSKELLYERINAAMGSEYNCSGLAGLD